MMCIGGGKKPAPPPPVSIQEPTTVQEPPAPPEEAPLAETQDKRAMRKASPNKSLFQIDYGQSGAQLNT